MGNRAAEQQQNLWVGDAHVEIMSSTPVDTSNLATTLLRQHKVAIPRLQRPGHGQNATKDRGRVPRACTTVR